jgi:ATP-dependent DNA ligase
MPQNLSDLKKEAQTLGLEVGQSGKRPAKEDYLSVLREHHLKRDFPNGLPYTELTPMVCFDYWNLDPKQQAAIWNDHNWIAQQKLNGCRLILHFVKGLGVFAHSRTTGAHSYRRSELTNRLLFSDFIPEFTATVDSEVICDKTIEAGPHVTKSSLQTTSSLLHMEAEASKRLQKELDLHLKVHVFDITNWEGQDLRLRKLCERLAHLPDFQAAITAAKLGNHFEFPPIFFQDKQSIYEKILAVGGEGVVLKNINYHYEDSNSRSRVGWVKVKKQVEFDAYVSGFERGKPDSEYENHVSCLIFSVATDKDHIAIAKVSNLPWFFRKEISVYDKETNQVKLSMDIYGKVAHVSGLELSHKARRLVHPRIVFWRTDLTQEQCVYSMADIEATRSGAVNPPLRIASVAAIDRTETLTPRAKRSNKTANRKPEA